MFIIICIFFIFMNEVTLLNQKFYNENALAYEDKTKSYIETHLKLFNCIHQFFHSFAQAYFIF